MLRRLGTLLVTGTFVFALGCASKKKTDGEGGAGADGAPTSAISSTEMSFDPTGSDSGSIAGLSTIYFDYDQSTLSSDSRRVLATNAEWIKDKGGVTVQVEGHCDERGTVEYNMALGERRAKSVKAYLGSLGVDAKRLTTISWGKEKPVAQGDSEAAYSKNRRANFVPVPK
jgi:peptidoglycan-associated lipoprotein